MIKNIFQFPLRLLKAILSKDCPKLKNNRYANFLKENIKIFKRLGKLNRQCLRIKFTISSIKILYAESYQIVVLHQDLFGVFFQTRPCGAGELLYTGGIKEILMVYSNNRRAKDVLRNCYKYSIK